MTPAESQHVGVVGWGAVSPAGWGMLPFREALARNEPWPTQPLVWHGDARPLHVRAVPAAHPRPPFLAHPRMRRTSPLAQYLVAAALEAIGTGEKPPATSRIGIVLCVMAGCVNYSKRFYAETLANPATASPLIFPETVFNAPASHLAALLGTGEINYTLVGDPGTYLQGLAVAAQWLLEDRVDGCLVAGAEEKDWMTSAALQMLNPGSVLSEGAGALYLRRVAPGEAITLEAVTSPQLYTAGRARSEAAGAMRAELPPGSPGDLLCDSAQGIAAEDAAERAAWQSWAGARLSPKRILGEAFNASAAWQCVAAVDCLHRQSHPAAHVSVVGCNEQTIGARFLASAFPGTALKS
jgi:hypothetical protein